jgi:hypothetical protein
VERELKLLGPRTLAEAKRNVEHLERLYARAEAERQAALRLLGD